MIPRRFLLLLCLTCIAGVAIIPAHTATHPANQGMTKGFCYSDTNATDIYFSHIFDANTKARTKISTAPLNFAFKNYLIEKYDYKSSSNFPSGCSLFQTLSQAEGRRSQVVGEAQRANKHVVEVNWNPGPLDEKPQGDESVAVGPIGPPPTHTICAVGHARTMYFSGVFDSRGSMSNPAWDTAFNDFLRKNYSAEGLANCTSMNTVREADRLLRDRVAGVRAQNNKAVETGWKFDPNYVASGRPGPRPTPKVDDDDPEPVITQKPPAKAAPADIRQFVTQEVPLALAYCQNDRMIAGSFDCYCMQRAVYNYRMEHANEPGPPEPLADLFAKAKLDLSQCIAPFVTAWATSHAQSQSLTRTVAECVAKRYEESLRAKPYPTQVKKLFNAAMAACR